MFSTSESTAKLDAALAKAQGEIETALADKPNEAFKRGGKVSKYADLASVMRAARTALSKHGIAVTQWPTHADDGRLHMITRLAHEGEWMRCEWSFPCRDQTAHGYGGAVTYSRRFSLASALGIVVDEDDDGNAASGVGNGKDSSLHGDVNTANGNPGVSKANARETYKTYSEEIRAQTTEPGLKKWGLARKPEIQTKLPPEWVGHLEQEYLERMDQIKRGAA